MWWHCISCAGFVELYESPARKPRLTVYRALQVKTTPGQVEFNLGQNYLGFLVGFSQFLAMCQFVLALVVYEPSCECPGGGGERQVCQKIDCKKPGLLQGRSCVTNFW